MANYHIPSDSDSEFEQEFPVTRRGRQICGYSAEPEVEDNAVYSTTSSEEEEEEDLGPVTRWCRCSFCSDMQTNREKLCCQNVTQCATKLGQCEQTYGHVYRCISYHPGFLACCTNKDVLDVAWFAYKEYMTADGAPAHEPADENKRYRYIAYRQLARFLFGIVGRHVRYVLPSCAVNRIRTEFSDRDENYTGFLD